MTAPTLFIAFKAFIERDGKVLVLRESATHLSNTQQGKFGIPGGRLQPGERYDEALTREVREETGLDVAFGQPFYVTEWRPVVRGEPSQIVAVFVRCASASGDVVLSEEHDAFEWINPRLYRQHQTIESEHAVFEAYLKMSR